MRGMTATIAFAVLLLPAVSAAQEVSAPTAAGSERRLTPEQVEAILDEAAAKRATSTRQAPAEAAAIEDVELTPAPQVHGEVGVSIGTGGYHEVFGTAIYPLGQDGLAIISLDFVDWGQRRYPEH